MPVLEEIIKTKPIEDMHMRAYLNIMYTGNWISNRVNQALKPFDLTEQQYNVLRILRGQQGETMSLFEIQDRMIQKMSNVSRLIDKLLQKGLVERKECKVNRRKVDIRITDAGLAVLNDAEAPIQANFSEIAQNFTAEEAKAVASMLDQIRNNL
jgi:DNA-binding MarR family transcriptional regulator